MAIELVGGAKAADLPVDEIIAVGAEIARFRTTKAGPVADGFGVSWWLYPVSEAEPG